MLSLLETPDHREVKYQGQGRNPTLISHTSDSTFLKHSNSDK